MRKSIALQAEMTEEFGACVFDVTLDCEDGAPVGGERDHAQMALALAMEAIASARRRGAKAAPRIAARVHPVDHPAFGQDLAILAGQGVGVWSHLMVPKVESARDVDCAVAALMAAAGTPAHAMPLHVLVESPAAVRQVFDIAAHPRVQSISFGLMDFVSSHGGAIPSTGMQGDGQFSHPLVVRAKLEIAAACHANGKVPAHCVVTEFRDTALLQRAAQTAATTFGFLRMWSIHPSQIRPILEAFAPPAREVDLALEIIELAQQAHWAPISYGGQLHDRASYRYYWQTLLRARQTGRELPAQARRYFEEPVSMKSHDDASQTSG